MEEEIFLRQNLSFKKSSQHVICLRFNLGDKGGNIVIMCKKIMKNKQWYVRMTDNYFVIVKMYYR